MENFLYGLFSAENGRNLYRICSPVNGRALDQSEIKDEIISCGELGQSFAVYPYDGSFASPCNGFVTAISRGGEKISLKSDDGCELLIRIGEGTGILNGEGISLKVGKGDRVAKGDILAAVDLDTLRSNNISVLSSVTLTNSERFSQFTVFEGECRAAVSEIMMFTDLAYSICRESKQREF